VDTLFRDIRHGVRNLLRHRGFAATAILSLGLGLGANSALFSIFNSLLWRPLPVASPDELVVLYRKNAAQTFYDAFSYAEYRDYREQAASVFTGLTGLAIVEVALGPEGTGGAAATRVVGELVTGDYFDVLGVRLPRGRGFTIDEDRPGGALAVVVSHGFWRSRLGGDPAAVGRTITLNNQAVNVVGIAPDGFRGAYAVYFQPDIWLPAAALPRLKPAQSAFLTDRHDAALRLLGRLAPGVSVAAAQAAVDTIAARLATAYPDTNKDMKAFVFREIDARPEVEIAAAANTVALIFLGLAGLVLLVACANVANLLLARAASRRREVAIRLAVGAGRSQLIRQLLVESLLLAAVSGVLAVGIGAVASTLLAGFRVPTDLPLAMSFHTDLRVAGYTLGLATLAAVVFGLWPAWQLSKTDLVPALKDDGTSASRRGRRVSLSKALVVAQVAASLMILVVAGLFVRSVSGARTLDPGFDTDHRIVMSLNPGLRGLNESDTREFYRRVSEAVRAVPGVETATLAAYVPLDFSIDGGDFVVEGRDVGPGREAIQAMASSVDEHYFATLNTAIRRGRPFTARDTLDASGVAIVNETFAAMAWPGQDPVGRRLRLARADAPWLEVVGVSADGKYRQLTESPRPFVWTALAQQRASSATLVVKSGRDAGALIGEVRRAIAALDPAVPVYDVKTMDAFMERAYTGPRLAALVIGPAAICALVIAAVGLYGVLAYWVSRRTREIGVRSAIGATPSSILALVMRQGLSLALLGVALGVAGAAAVSRLVATLLFGVSATDPLVFTTVPAALLLVAAAASYIPARRAVRIDPVEALRQA
jgi:predicted permease